MFHKEAYNIPTFARTEILKNPFGRRNHKGGCLFVGKRAQSFIIGPTFFQGHKVRDHLHNVSGLKDLVYGLLINHLGCGKSVG